MSATVFFPLLYVFFSLLNSSALKTTEFNIVTQAEIYLKKKKRKEKNLIQNIQFDF